MEAHSDDGLGPLISWPGYGIMFFYQLGIMQHLRASFDTSRCNMVGSSAGSLLSVLAACDVPPQASLDLAHQLCVKHGVFSRPLGLIGVWGGIVREWLQELLPPDAAERCSGRVRIVLTTLPWLRRHVVTQFTDTADLISACLASCHVPLLMDWRAAAAHRGRACVDGSLLYILTRRCPALRPAGSLSRLLLFDPWADGQLLSRGWRVLRCVLACGKAGAQQLVDLGAAHAAALDAAGGLALLQPLRRQPDEAQQQQGQGQQGQHAALAKGDRHGGQLPMQQAPAPQMGLGPPASPSSSCCSSVDVVAVITDYDSPGLGKRAGVRGRGDVDGACTDVAHTV